MTGIIIADKPEGLTSFAVVRQIRRATGEKKIGHSGTLDPMATGVLAVFLGRATRAIEFAMEGTKRYRARLHPGLVTDTQDTTGTILWQTDASVSREQLEKVLPQFRGEIQPRTITIHSLIVAGEENGDFILDVECSKGTYIRTLCNDIGEALGCGACMAALRRTGNGPFDIKNAHSLEQILAAPEKCLLPVETLFTDSPVLFCSREQERRLRNGADSDTDAQDGVYRVYSEEGEFLLLGRAEEGTLRTVKSFFETESEVALRK